MQHTPILHDAAVKHIAWIILVCAFEEHWTASVQCHTKEQHTYEVSGHDSSLRLCSQAEPPPLSDLPLVGMMALLSTCRALPKMLSTVSMHLTHC